MDDTTKVQLLALTAAAGASLASYWLAKSQTTQSSSSSSSSTKNKLAGEHHFVPPFVGALDQGTSSTRFIIFDSRTNIVVSHQMELPPLYPQPGWAEHSGEAILRQSEECIAGAVAKLEALGYAASDIKAVGITNQRETTLVWDRITGVPLYNAIVWLDSRTHAIVEELLQQENFQAAGKDTLRPVCGLPLSTYFSATKLVWLIKNVPAVQQAIQDDRCIFGTVDTWLIWNLTGGPNGGAHVTDVTNASRTMLMNLKTLQWDSSACEVFGIPMSILPRIRSSAEEYGHIMAGPLAGVPLTCCLGDQQAALVGHMCFARGEAKNTYGTGCFLLVNTGEEIVHSKHGLTTVGYQLGPAEAPHYALEGAVAMAGEAVRWLLQDMQLISSYSEIEPLAGSVDDAGGMYFVPAFTGLLAPHWRSDARGVAVGMSSTTKRAHFVRAVLEGVAFQTCEVLEALAEDSNLRLKSLKVGGGMAVNNLFLQIQADLLGIEVTRGPTVETTALGAAVGAGLAVGVYSREFLTELHAHAETGFEPRTEPGVRQEKAKGWAKAVRKSFSWADGQAA